MLDEYDDPNEKAKQFLRRYGKWLIAIVVIVFLVISVGSLYGRRLQRMRQKNAGLYSLLLQEKDPSHASLLVEEIQKGDAKGLYAIFAHFYLAHLYFEHHELKNARDSLLWLVDHAPAPWSSLAILRAASVMIDLSEYDRALTLLRSQPASYGFQPSFWMREGDILLLKKDHLAAQHAYQKALSAIDHELVSDHSMDSIKKTIRAALQAKLLSMGVSA